MFEEGWWDKPEPVSHTSRCPSASGTASKQFSTPAGMGPVSLELTHISVSQSPEAGVPGRAQADLSPGDPVDPGSRLQTRLRAVSSRDLSSVQEHLRCLGLVL